MSNKAILGTILDVLDRFQASEVSVFQVEMAIESHSQALEGVGLKDIYRLRELLRRLVMSDCSSGEDVAREPVEEVLNDIRAFVDELSAR